MPQKEYGQIIVEYKIKSWVGDTVDFRKVISPALQEWYGLEVVPKLLAAELEKIALVAPEEFIANLSVEPSIDEILSPNAWINQ